MPEVAELVMNKCTDMSNNPSEMTTDSVNYEVLHYSYLWLDCLGSRIGSSKYLDAILLKIHTHNQQLPNVVIVFYAQPNPKLAQFPGAIQLQVYYGQRNGDIKVGGQQKYNLNGH